MDFRDTYIEMLKTEYRNRHMANGMYSLRAYARDLGLEPPRLSMIFAKSRGLSSKRASKLITVLKWPNEDKALFLDLIESVHARSRDARNAAAKRIKIHLVNNLKRLEKFVEDDLFKQIADPLHYQIIEALKLENFQATTQSLKKVINYPLPEIKKALNRLLSLGLIKSIKGKFVVQEYILRTSEKDPSMALRQHHSLQLKAALKSINEQSIHERALSSLTIAIPKEVIPEIFEKISEFRKEINEYILNHNQQSKTDVYCLATQFFRLSKER